MRIQYNAPVTLTYTFISAAFIILKEFLFIDLTSIFSVGGYGSMAITNPVTYIRLFTHVIGHGSWEHFMGNFTYILLLGPILEEKYGSKQLLNMILVTAFITGIINAIFLSSGLLGASGVVFMFILLSSIVNVQKGGIPLTFVLIVILFLGQELLSAFDKDNISQLAHVIGGICGAIFGFSIDKHNSKKIES
ncbi:rhomboid family intramembrane serine protease [Flammeovirga kamogawensis]|uniref:Rhomboid family intramembrane serine protease n=1 Tax=Flammeovirga kamogawensis TaxID=373891 RepID=A0ABX8GUK1_9BACT|nr:rhomboid family intramembrane serine protease [Flammeovirga kamogawensis]MBB6459662.1 membrane associated rhomboid family serine protease [Flammeovirga kamogawensis]QWG07275.1 rhomboid family intramembrane serine protease [Flammeovirga kamogawensis]TRX69095.1 rhomboid family intramembrane serine protease [Flammeovirga kamogawensis]